MMRLQPTLRGREGRVRAISPIGKTWMNGSTLQVRFIGGSAGATVIVSGSLVKPPSNNSGFHCAITVKAIIIAVPISKTLLNVSLTRSLFPAPKF